MSHIPTGQPFQDACPECVGPIARPRKVTVNGNDACAEYVCDECEHGWSTNWNLTVLTDEWDLGPDCVVEMFVQPGVTREWPGDVA